MNDDYSLGRFLKLAGLTLLLATMIYVLQLFLFAIFHINFPQFLRVLISVLAAGLLVYKYFEDRVF